MVFRSLLRSLLAFIISGILFLACNKEYDGSNASNPNSAKPVAIANENTTVLYPKNKITLDASKSYHPEGNPLLEYNWRQLSGPTLPSLQGINNNFLNKEIEFFELGNYSIELTVSSYPNQYSKDTFIVVYDSELLSKKVVVSEYYTSLPIQGVEFEICLDPTQVSCRGQLQKFVSDGTGELHINTKAYSITPKNLSAKKYWEKVPGFSEGDFFSAKNTYPIIPDYVLTDSVQFFVVPKIEIPVRVMDTRSSSAQPTRQLLGYGVVKDYIDGKTIYLDNLIDLRPGIDTIFRLPVFGFLRNGISVSSQWGSYSLGIYPVGGTSQFHLDTVFNKQIEDTLYIKY
jgi:hypothetical protein